MYIQIENLNNCMSLLIIKMKFGYHEFLPQNPHFEGQII